MTQYGVRHFHSHKMRNQPVVADNDTDTAIHNKSAIENLDLPTANHENHKGKYREWVPQTRTEETEAISLK